MTWRKSVVCALALCFLALEIGCAGGGSSGIGSVGKSGGGNGGGQAGKGPDPFSAIAPMVQPHQAAASARFLAGALQGSVLVTGGISSVSGSVQPAPFAEIFNPQTQTFTPVANMNTPRAYHAAVGLSDGTVLVVGGIDNLGNVLNTAEIFDPARGTFRTLASVLPVGVQLPVVVPFCSTAAGPFGSNLSVPDPTQPGGCPNGQYIHVLIAGGFTDVGATTPTNRAVIFDPATGQFNAIANLRTAVGAAAGVAVPSGTGSSAGTAPDIVIFGGVGPNGASVAAVQLYKLSTRTNSLYNGSWDQSNNLLTTPRAYFTATRLVEGAGNTSNLAPCNNYVVLAGGQNFSANQSSYTVVTTAEVYAPASTGGQIGTMLSGTFNLANAGGRFAHSAELIEPTSPGEAGQILLTGGINISGGGPTALNDAEFLVPQAGTNTCTGLTAQPTGGPMVYPHAFQLAIRLLDGTGRIVVAGGSDNSGVPSRRAELFTP